MNLLSWRSAVSVLALASVASPALAQTAITTSTTVALDTSDTTGGFTVSSVGEVAVTGNAIDIGSGLATENVIDISTGGNVTATGIAISASGDVSASTITNAGTLSGGTAAVDLSLMTSEGVTFTNSGTISGTVTLTGADDTIVFNGGTINAAFDAGAGTDALDVTGDFTTGAAISGVEAYTISGGSTFAVGHTLTGGATMAVAASSTLDLNTDLTLSGALTQAADSTVSVNAGSTLTADTYSPTATSIYNVGVSGTTTGLLTIASAAVDFTNVSVTVTTEGFVADGTSLTIATGSAGSTVGGPVSETSYLYDYTLLSDGNNIDMTVSRTSLSSVATSALSQGVGTALDDIGETTNTQLDSIQDQLAAATTAQGVQDILESLAPAVNGAVAAATEAGAAVVGSVESRVAEARSAQNGLAAGSPVVDGHMWLRAFGQTSDQDERNGTAGYNANTYGFTIGADRSDIIQNGTVGLALSYGSAEIDSDAASNAKTDADTYQLTMYGTQDLNNGMYVEGLVGAGYNSYETNRYVSALSSNAKGDYNGMQYTAKAGLGKVFENNGLTFNPFGSLQYSHVTTDEYTETGAGGASLVVDNNDFSTATLAVGAKTSYDIMSGSTLFRPNLGLTYMYDIKHDTAEADASFVGGGASFKSTGLETSRSGVRAGVGLDILSNNGMEFKVNYDADVRDEYLSHTGTVNLRWKF